MNLDAAPAGIFAVMTAPSAAWCSAPGKSEPRCHHSTKLRNTARDDGKERPEISMRSVRSGMWAVTSNDDPRPIIALRHVLKIVAGDRANPVGRQVC